MHGQRRESWACRDAVAGVRYGASVSASISSFCGRRGRRLAQHVRVPECPRCLRSSSGSRPRRLPGGHRGVAGEAVEDHAVRRPRGVLGRGSRARRRAPRGSWIITALPAARARSMCARNQSRLHFGRRPVAIVVRAPSRRKRRHHLRRRRGRSPAKLGDTSPPRAVHLGGLIRVDRDRRVLVAAPPALTRPDLAADTDQREDGRSHPTFTTRRIPAARAAASTPSSGSPRMSMWVCASKPPGSGGVTQGTTSPDPRVRAPDGKNRRRIGRSRPASRLRQEVKPRSRSDYSSPNPFLPAIHPTPLDLIIRKKRIRLRRAWRSPRRPRTGPAW